MASKHLKAVCEVGNFEKPSAVIPHAEIGERQLGNWLFYLDGLYGDTTTIRVGVIYD
jgi:hypothetical protein